MFSARITLLVLLVSFIVFQHADAWRRRRRRRCPVRDCEVSYWSSWSSCSANSCGQRGHQSRSRTITSYSSCGGAACPSSLHETRQCYSSALVNCRLSSWSEWSACTATSCHVSGTQSSSRHRITTEQCGGTCTSTFRKTRTCSRTSVDCQVSSWSGWSACVNTSTCDLSGTQTSTRDKIAEEKCGGRCSSSLQKTRQCLATGTPSIPVDCQLSSWSEWSACTLTTCDVSSGIQFSTRHKIIKEKCGGTCTSMLRKSKSCTSNLTCQNGGSLNGGSCLCTKGFSGVCCEKADSSSQGKTSSLVVKVTGPVAGICGLVILVVIIVVCIKNNNKNRVAHNIVPGVSPLHDERRWERGYVAPRPEPFVIYQGNQNVIYFKN